MNQCDEYIVGWNAVEHRPAHLDLPMHPADVADFKAAMAAALDSATRQQSDDEDARLESARGRRHGESSQEGASLPRKTGAYSGASDYIRPTSLSFFMLMRSEKCHSASGCSHAIAQPDLFEIRATFTSPLRIRLGYGDTMMIVKALDILEAPPALYTTEAAPSDSQDDVYVDASHLTGLRDPQGAILELMHRNPLDRGIRREEVRGRFAATLLVLASMTEFVDKDFVQIPYTFREVGRAVADYKHGLEALESEIKLVHPDFRLPPQRLRGRRSGKHSMALSALLSYASFCRRATSQLAHECRVMDFGTKWGGIGSHEPELVRAERLDGAAMPFALAHELSGRLLEDNGDDEAVAQYVGAAQATRDQLSTRKSSQAAGAKPAGGDDSTVPNGQSAITVESLGGTDDEHLHAVAQDHPNGGTLPVVSAWGKSLCDTGYYGFSASMSSGGGNDLAGSADGDSLPDWHE